MTELKIKAEIENITLDTVIHEGGDSYYRTTVADLVVQEIVRQFAAGHGDVWSSLSTRVSQVRTEVIREMLTPLIAEALTQPVQQTNSYGEPTGPETTLRDLIVKEAHNALTKPAAYPHEQQSIVTKTIREEVTRAFRQEVSAAVAQAREQVADEIGKVLAETVSAGLRKTGR